MPTLLHLDSSPLETSISRALTREFAATWDAAHPGGTVHYRDLSASPAPPVDAAWIGATFTPEAARTQEQIAQLALSDELIDELYAADEIVIGVAMHNFTIPAVLKLWIDQIVRPGRTFSYGAAGPKGLLAGKKVTVLSATGGVYELGTPAGAMNFIDPYLKAILGFIGLTGIEFFTAGGVAQIMSGAMDRETFLKPVLEGVRQVAA